MRNILGILLVITAGLTGSLRAQKTPAPKPAKTAPKGEKPASCELKLERADSAIYQSFGGEGTTILSRDVHLACEGKQVTLSTDSLISIGDNYSVVTAIRNVVYHGEKYDITGDTLRRFVADTHATPKVGERILVVGNVHITDRKTGSTLVGPAVNYILAIPGSGDSDQVLAFNRPTATVFPDRTGKEKTPPSPYVIIADRLKGWGSEKINAYGTAIITRDSLSATGDSVLYQTGKTKLTRAFGAPARVVRLGADSVRVVGRDILMGFGDDGKLKDLKASGDGVLYRDKVTIVADTVLVGLKGDALSTIFAWDRVKRSHLQREGYDAYGDSLAVDSKDDHISELRLFGKGLLYQPLDSTLSKNPADSLHSKDRDWIGGARVIVSFRQSDSAGTSLTVIDKLVADQNKTKSPSCSLFSKAPEAPVAGKVAETRPTINYACANEIVVHMKAGPQREVGNVSLHGNVNGVQLQPSTSAPGATVPPVKRP